MTPTGEREISAVSWRFLHNLGAEWHIWLIIDVPQMICLRGLFMATFYTLYPRLNC